MRSYIRQYNKLLISKSMNLRRISASCFCLLLAGNLAVSAQTVTLGSNKVSLKAAFEKIEKASKYKIAYNSSLIDANRTVTISKTKGDVLEILNLLLKESGCTYEKNGNYLIVKPQSKKQPGKKNIKRVTGQLLDEMGEPMIGVTVMVKGTTTGVVTDIDGNFTIEDVPADASELHVSHIGYEAKDVQISSSLQIKMTPDNEQLDEVVVVGYGTVKKNDLTGSVSAIKPDEFNRGAKSSAQDDKSRDVLVKFLHNEKEVHIPVKTDIWPYYHWNEVKEYYQKRLSALPQ